MANLIVDAVPQSDVGIATGINTVMRTVGGAFGAAAATAILTADTLGGSPLPTEGAYTTAFLVSAGGGAARARRRALVPARRDPGGDGGARVRTSAGAARGAEPSAQRRAHGLHVGLRPVNRRCAWTPWWSSMRRPVTTGAPAARAARTSAVSPPGR